MLPYGFLFLYNDTMITFAKNSFATRKNYMKYVKYLEHNNKNNELIIDSDT